MDYRAEYDRWLSKIRFGNEIDPIERNDLLCELSSMNEQQIEDAFYRNLAFGTGGLRGTIGAGTNRMNVLTVAKATQGLSNYLLSCYESPSVVIGYDSRLKSDVFAKEAASVFAANGIKVFAWKTCLPVPTVSYAVRHLHASVGVMITASHNPSQYNGYKVYGSDGCQITIDAATDILEQIEIIDIFSDIARLPWKDALSIQWIEFIPENVLDSFINEVKKQSVLYGDDINHDIAIVYTPLNGTGLVPVMRVLQESGFSNITVVEEQRYPDGNFPTCPYPNPEIREAMELGLHYCESSGADMLIATDPDCDRCGIAVKEGSSYKLLTGNEVGILLLDYICSQRSKHKNMPAHPVFVKTIVTMDLAEKIAAHYGVETINVLTGFKFIGEVIGRLESEGRTNEFIFGFEESYGYLTGTYVRDKDAVNAAFLISEMFAFYKTHGISLSDKLEKLYSSFGYCLNTLHSYEFAGNAGFTKMQRLMASFRNDLNSFGDTKSISVFDYIKGLDGLPKADVLKYQFEGGTVVIRPSGTEPKLKIYISVAADDKETAVHREKKILDDLENRIGK